MEFLNAANFLFFQPPYFFLAPLLPPKPSPSPREKLNEALRKRIFNLSPSYLSRGVTSN